MNARDRFLSFVERTECGYVTPCLLWTGAFAGHYGTFWYQGKQILAHRAAIILLSDRTLPAAKGYDVDHRCRIKACVNPEHLEVANFGAPVKQVCKRGHQMTPENIYRGKHGILRQCRACNKIRNLATQLRRVLKCK
jgi:hydroxylamine reductase (hybrid-cluster protein)